MVGFFVFCNDWLSVQSPRLVGLTLRWYTTFQSFTGSHIYSTFLFISPSRCTFISPSSCTFIHFLGLFVKGLPARLVLIYILRSIFVCVLCCRSHYLLSSFFLTFSHKGSCQFMRGLCLVF